MRTITVNVLDYIEFEKLVKTHLGISNFESVCAYEWDNCSDQLFDHVTAGPRYDRFKPETPKETIDKFWRDEMNEVENMIATNGKETAGAADILNWMCSKKYIEPGNYLISIFW